MAAGSLETKIDVIKEQIVLACGALVGNLELVLEPGRADRAVQRARLARRRRPAHVHNAAYSRARTSTPVTKSSTNFSPGVLGLSAVIPQGSVTAKMLAAIAPSPGTGGGGGRRAAVAAAVARSWVAAGSLETNTSRSKLTLPAVPSSGPSNLSWSLVGLSGACAPHPPTQRAQVPARGTAAAARRRCGGGREAGDGSWLTRDET